MLSPGVVISGGTRHQLGALARRAAPLRYATVDDSVLLDGVDVGRHAAIRRAIIDKDVVVPEGASVGVDREHDLARGFVVTESGITIVGKGQRVDV